MQHNENSKPNRFQHFLREKGYYIVLALCICAVGVSGWLFLSGRHGDGDPGPAGENAHTAVCKQACRRH